MTRACWTCPKSARRQYWRQALRKPVRRIHLTPLTRDRAVAADWFSRFEGAGPRRRHRQGGHGPLRTRQAAHDQDQARTHGRLRGGWVSLAQEWARHAHRLPDPRVCSTRTMCSTTWASRLPSHGIDEPHWWMNWPRCGTDALDDHPWQEWAAWSGDQADSGQRMPGATSRWNRGKDLSWEPLRIERVCEVAYDHLQGDRFRHATTFRRWRPDRSPADCRYDQLEATAPYELQRIFADGYVA